LLKVEISTKSHIHGAQLGAPVLPVRAKCPFTPSFSALLHLHFASIVLWLAYPNMPQERICMPQLVWARVRACACRTVALACMSMHICMLEQLEDL